MIVAVLMFLPISVIASASVHSTDILFVASNESDKASILSNSKINDYRDQITINVITEADYTANEYSNYSALAIPCGALSENSLSELYFSLACGFIFMVT